MYQTPRMKLTIVREGTIRSEVKTVTNSQTVFDVLKPHFAGHDREEFVVLLLDAKRAIRGLHTVAIGSLTMSIVHPRETFKAAIVASAAAIILAHNHPSGDPTPSPEDRALTARLKECGTLLGIPVLDHVIVGDERYISFADNGWL